MLFHFDLKKFQEKVSTQLRPWQRSFQFWVRAADIYTGYKVFQVRASLEKDVKKQEVMWEKQHEVAADKIYSMCSELGCPNSWEARLGARSMGQKACYSM